MAELFANSGDIEANFNVPAPNLQGDFIPAIDIPDFQDGFGLITPLGGGASTRRYRPYGVSQVDSWQDTQLLELQLPSAIDVSYNFEGLVGAQGIPGRDGRDGVTTIIGLPAINSNFLTALPYNIDSINDLGTAVDKLIYTSAYNTTITSILPTDLASGTTDGDTLPEPWPPTEPEEREITFGSPVELVSGTVYAIVVRATSANFANRALWHFKSAGTYSNGARNISTDSGSSWAAQGSNDMWFQTKASGDIKDNYTFAYTGAGGDLHGASWEAQTFLASSTYNISSVILQLFRVAGATPGTITVTIRQCESYSQATWAESTLTSAGRALIDDANAAAQATTLGLGTGDAVTHDTLTLASIAAEGTDVDKFLVDSTGVIKFRTGAEVLSDIGGSSSAHLHDTQTLLHDGVNSDGGAFAFNTTGLVTFNQSIAAANYAAANLFTAAATNAGEVDFTAASKKLDVEDNAVVSQDYSSDASPTFAGLIIDTVASLPGTVVDGKIIRLLADKNLYLGAFDG